MHLDLQSIINYVTLGMISLFLSVIIFSLLTNKVISYKKKIEEERIQKLHPQKTYKSSKVHTFSVPKDYSVTPQTLEPFEQKKKTFERFEIVNESLKRTETTFLSGNWK